MNIEIAEGNNNRIITISIAENEKLDSEKEYEFIMIDRNSIPVFLDHSSRYAQGENIHEYKIGGMISLLNLSQQHLLNSEELIMMIRALGEARKAVYEYLLTKEGLILDPEYIFYDKRKKRIRYCFFPYYKEDMFSNYLKLGEFLLSAIEYEDEMAVKMAYDIYASILNKDYDFSEYMNIDGCEKLENKGELIEDTGNEEAINEIKEYTLYEESLNCRDTRDLNLCENAKNNYRNKARLSGYSIVSLTVLIMVFIMLGSLFILSRRLFLYFFSNLKVISVTVLIVSLLLLFPIINISDMKRSGN